MRQSHLILSNTLIIWASRILSLVPRLILVPYLISTIGEVGYGFYALIWPLMMSIDFLANSLQSGVVKYSAGFLMQGSIQEVNKIVSSSFIYSIAFAVLACAGILFAAAFYNDSSGHLGSTLAVMSVMVLFIIPLTPYVAVIQSRQYYYIGSIARIISQYISLATVVIWFNFMTPSFEALIIIMAVMLFLSRLVQVPIAYRLIPGLQNRLHLFNMSSFRLITLFGAAMILMSVCLAANTTGIRWLMNMLASPGFVAHLAIMIMPASLLRELIEAMTLTFMPATSAYEATGNQQMLKELLLRGMRYTTTLVLAGLLVSGFLMRNVLSVWLGPDYAFLAPYALALFAGAAFLEGTSISHHMLKGLGKLRAVVLIYLFGLVIIPTILILLMFHTWHDPYIAVTVGLTVGYFICGCLQVGVCIKAVHIDFREILLRSYAQPLMVAAAVYLSALGVVTINGIDGLVGRMSIAVLAIMFFFSGCYSLIATATERQQVKEIIKIVKSKMILIQN